MLSGLMIWLAADSALAKRRFSSFSQTSPQNILSPPSYKGGIFDKGEDVFGSQV
jgi:hypothetical protein